MRVEARKQNQVVNTLLTEDLETTRRLIGVAQVVLVEFLLVSK